MKSILTSYYIIILSLLLQNSSHGFIGKVKPVPKVIHDKTQYKTINIIINNNNNKHVITSLEKQSLRGGSAIQAWPLTKDPKGMAPDFPLTSTRIAITITSTVATWYAQHFLGHSNVMASAAFTLICSMCLDKRLGQATFCGSFAGMSSMTLIPNIYWALGLGGLTSILFEILIHSKNLFLGIGGRLGATAFLATSIIAFIRNVSTGLFANDVSLNSVLQGVSSSQNTLYMMIVWHAIGSIATIALREAGDDTTAADPVRASAVIGLLGALLLKDKTAALGLYGGSFVGMSLPSRLMYGILPGSLKEGAELPIPSTFILLLAFGFAGALGGVGHAVANAMGYWTGAWGGKAGLFAFIGCLIYRALGKTRALVLKKDVAVGLST